MTNHFPRGTELPTQSPLFWVNHKDRYLRQLLIKDIKETTGRDLLVYFTDCDRSPAQIDQTDDIYLAELLSARDSDKVDLLLETNGGMTDATEKICSILRNANLDLRVIIPRRAKSNGTVIAFCGHTIIMGSDSELGPIDPFVGGIPADFILKASANLAQRDPVLIQAAIAVVKQTTELATNLLLNGMLQGKTETEVRALVQQLATREQYHSHGAVIDVKEAKDLGLNVDDESGSKLWHQIWLLRTMYAFDCQQHNYAKIFESEKISSPVSIPTQAQT